MGVYSKIEWADSTLDFITGCRHGCPYCYARNMSMRFSGNVRENLTKTEKYRKTGEGNYILEEPFRTESGAQLIYPFGFEPTLHAYRFTGNVTTARVVSGGGKRIFVGAMSDLFGDWVPDDWIQSVFDFCASYPLQNYIFLTKNPKRYALLREKGRLPNAPNWWYGTSVTCQKDASRMIFLPPAELGYHTFISYEPILGPLNYTEMSEAEKEKYRRLEWIIMGAETGRNNKLVIPDRKWVQDIVETAGPLCIPVFMKDSLIPTVREKNMIRDFPQELTIRKRSRKERAKLEAACMICGKQDNKSNMVAISGRVSTRGFGTHNIGYMCWPCLQKFCEERGMDFQKIKDGITKKTGK